MLDMSGNILTSLDSTTWLLAMLPGIEPEEIGPIRLHKGQLALLMTDGLLEARSPAGEDFGLDRALEVTREHQRAPAAEILDALYLAVDEFTRRKWPEDDITLVVLKRVDEPKWFVLHKCKLVDKCNLSIPDLPRTTLSNFSGDSATAGNCQRLLAGRRTEFI